MSHPPNPLATAASLASNAAAAMSAVADVSKLCTGKRGEAGTAEKIANLVQENILSNEALTAICQEANLFSPHTEVEITPEYGRGVLEKYVCQYLRPDKVNYRLYQRFDSPKKDDFRAKIATELAVDLLKTLDKKNFVWIREERPGEKDLVTGNVVLTPLTQEAVEQTVLKVAKIHGIGG